MKKLAFDVIVSYEHEDEQTDVIVKIEREKTFNGADSYQQAWDYYEKRKKAADSRYTMDEGYYDEKEADGKKYRSEECQFVTPNRAWVVVKLDVRVMNC
jgi:hypothetical protein